MLSKLLVFWATFVAKLVRVLPKISYGLGLASPALATILEPSLQ
jgi:hypothetical protein